MLIAISFDGRTTLDCTELDLTRTDGTPVDSFEAKLLWSESAAAAARAAKRVYIYADGRKVFTGVADEVVSTRGGDGRVLEVAGRGLAALLMRQELSGVEYAVAAWEDVKERIVDPCGVAAAVDRAALGTVRRFSITSGRSAWQALCDWAGAAGLISPRFSTDGVLLLDRGGGGVLRLDEGSAIFRAERRTLPYGAISEVVVSERTSGRSEVVVDHAMREKGVVGRAAIAAARGALEARLADARWLLEKSRRGYDRFAVELAGGFVCEPGDRMEASVAGLPARGRVASVRTRFGMRGVRCTVEGVCDE